MQGQWIGTYNGSPNGGTIIVNVDERESSFQAMGYVFPEANTLPNPVAYFSTPNKTRHFQCRTGPIQAVDPASANVLLWEKVKVRYDEHVIFPQYGDITGSWDENSLSLSWVTDIGSTGNCVLPRSRAAEPSELVAVEKDWGAYKEYGRQRLTMTEPREQAHQLIDRLPETQVSALVGLLKSIVDPVAAALRNAPIDDEPETGDEKQSAAGARDWLARHGGKGIPHDEAMRRLGLE